MEVQDGRGATRCRPRHPRSHPPHGRREPDLGAPRVLSELLLLGHDVAESTVSKYLAREPKPPWQTWRTFLADHAHQIAACDFFTVPTVTFRVLYVFLVLRHECRHVVHSNVTTSPTARWASQQIVEAFPFDEASRFLLRDRDGIYGQDFSDRAEHIGIEQVLITTRSPWQNPYAERVIGSIRRECLDHVVVLNEDHLRRILTDYFDYYHNARPHLALERNSPPTKRRSARWQGCVEGIPRRVASFLYASCVTDRPTDLRRSS